MEANDTKEALKHVYKSQLYPANHHSAQESRTQEASEKLRKKQGMKQMEIDKANKMTDVPKIVTVNPPTESVKDEVRDRFSDEMSV